MGDIAVARDKMMKKIVERSLEEVRSNKSKSRSRTRKTSNAAAALFGSPSQGRKSMNDSIEIMSNSQGQEQIFQTAALAHNTSIKPALVHKPRAFNHDYIANTIMLDLIGAKNYDYLDDLRTLELHVQNGIDQMMMKWKTNDVVKVKEMIKYCTIKELNRLEERKYANR